MSDLKVKVFKGERATTTFTIPRGVLKVAAKLLPKRAAAALQDKGIDLKELAALADDGAVQGTLVEVEDHEKGERIVIALE